MVSLSLTYLPLSAGEVFSDGEGLAHKLLQFSGAGDTHFVFGGKFVHTEDSDDVLQVFVTLQCLLNSTSYFVVFVTDHFRLESGRCGGERIDGGVDTEFGNLTGQYGCRVQVAESGGRSGVGQVVGRYNKQPERR